MTTDTLDAKRAALDKAQKKAETATAEATRLQAELQMAQNRFFGLYMTAQSANDDLHQTETTILRMKNLVPSIPPEGCDIVEFLAEMPPQKLAEMAGQHIHATLPGIALLERVQALQLARFESAADAVVAYAAEVGIPDILLVQFGEWRAMNPERRFNPTFRPFQQ
jgi:hypothetical protein